MIFTSLGFGVFEANKFLNHNSWSWFKIKILFKKVLKMILEINVDSNTLEFCFN